MSSHEAYQEHPVLELGPTESWNLLAGSELGRLAVSVGDVPEIFPINYLAHNGVVLFCTAEGSKLVNLTINRNVALETDGFTDDFAGASLFTARRKFCRTRLKQRRQRNFRCNRGFLP